jgi:predicted GNAT family acetyltransferase
MLHVAGTNDTAKRVYDRLGFEVRRRLEFVALETPGDGAVPA